MLERLHAVAARLGPLRPVALAALVVGLAGFGWAAWSAAADRYLIAALLTAVWGGWWFTLLAAFGRALPDPGDGETLRARLRRRIARAGYLTMAWLLLASGGAAVFLSVRLLTLDASP
ncbi:MAG TPA: hypothetical protein VF210_07120 [Pseudomonadales bacterium]